MSRGYTAPEYAIHGQLSEKVDTYSFGVVVLEILSGRKSNDTKLDPETQYLLEWVSSFLLKLYFSWQMHYPYYNHVCIFFIYNFICTYVICALLSHFSFLTKLCEVETHLVDFCYMHHSEDFYGHWH